METQLNQAILLKEPDPQIYIPKDLDGLPLWGEVLLMALSVGAINTAISSFKEIILQRMVFKKDSLKMIASFEKMSKIYDLLQDMLDSLKADSINLCKASNGGEIPKVTTSLALTILYEVSVSPKYSVKEFWSHRLVSKEMFEELIKVFSDQQIYSKDQNLLGEIFNSEGLESLVLLPICSNVKEFYFLMIKYKSSSGYEFGYNEAKATGFLSIIKNNLS